MTNNAVSNTYLKRIHYTEFNPPLTTGATLGLSAKGDILTHDGTDAQRVQVGTNTHAIVADSAQTVGWKWAALTDGTTLGLSAKGDILTHDGTDAQRLALGTDDHVLTAASGQTTGLQWTTKDFGAYVHGWGSGDQTIPNNAATPVTFDNEFQGPNWPGSSSTVPSTGVYRCSCYVTWAFTSSGERWIAITVNGTHVYHVANQPVNGLNSWAQGINQLVSLTAGDTVVFSVSQNTGGNTNIRGTASFDSQTVPRTFFSIERIA